MTTFGAVVKGALGDRWKLATGLFSFAGARSARLPAVSDVDDESDGGFSDGRCAAVHGRFDVRRIAAIPAIHARRPSATAPVRHSRRHVEREFGGDAITDLGTIALSSQARFAQPAGAFALPSRDTTRQLGLGLTFEERGKAWVRSRSGC